MHWRSIISALEVFQYIGGYHQCIVGVYSALRGYRECIRGIS